jgi:hypothetical protein
VKRLIIYQRLLHPCLYLSIVILISHFPALAQGVRSAYLVSGNLKNTGPGYFRNSIMAQKSILTVEIRDMVVHPDNKRVYLVGSINIAGYGGSLIALN